MCIENDLCFFVLDFTVLSPICGPDLQELCDNVSKNLIFSDIVSMVVCVCVQIVFDVVRWCEIVAVAPVISCALYLTHDLFCAARRTQVLVLDVKIEF